ncbi:MAG: hypothetical protein R6X25_05840 [Candidatus Krumholzibacteriia bacterium]
MYRINLHPEYVAARRAGRHRTLLLGLAVALLGAEALLVGSLAVSARLLEDRAENVRASIERTRSQAAGPVEVAEGDVRLARAILQVRQARIDWSPQLAALSERIGPELVLETVKGTGPGPRRSASMQLEGRFRSGRESLTAVTEFVGSLREDERIAAVLPRCSIGEMLEGPRPGFTVSCLPVEAKR